MDAQAEAVAIYSEAYERLCELAQTTMSAKPLTSRRVSQRAVIALRALRAESRPLDAMKPAPTRVCCLQCAAYLAAPAELKPVPLEEAFL